MGLLYSWGYNCSCPILLNDLYDSARDAFLNGEISYLNDNIKMALVSNEYCPDLGNDVYLNEISLYIIGNTKSLFEKTMVDGAADCEDILFTNLDNINRTLNYLVLYKDTGDPNTSKLIALFGSVSGLPFGINLFDIEPITPEMLMTIGGENIITQNAEFLISLNTIPITPLYAILIVIDNGPNRLFKL